MRSSDTKTFRLGRGARNGGVSLVLFLGSKSGSSMEWRRRETRSRLGLGFSDAKVSIRQSKRNQVRPPSSRLAPVEDVDTAFFCKGVQSLNFCLSNLPSRVNFLNSNCWGFLTPPLLESVPSEDSVQMSDSFAIYSVAFISARVFHSSSIYHARRAPSRAPFSLQPVAELSICNAPA